MTEINKLKTEHARYKKSLQKICHGYATHTNAAQWAEAALNPPPLPPPASVTLVHIQTALSRKGDTYCNPSIEIFFDGSATLIGHPAHHRSAFNTVQEALSFLNDTGAA